MAGDNSVQTRRFLIVQVITFARVPLVVAFAVILLTVEHTTSVLFLCAGILGLAELTDMFDGILARKLDTVTEWGAMLDPYIDSVSRLIVYWALACSGLAVSLVPLVMALRDVTVAYSRITLFRHGGSISARLSGKIKAEVQGGGAALLVLGPVYWQYTGNWTIHVLSWAVIVVTALSAVEYIAAAYSSAVKKGGGGAG